MRGHIDDRINQKRNEMKTYDELPVKIQARMLEARIEQGKEANADVFRNSISSGFLWVETKEGDDAWYEALIDDDYELLYQSNPDLRPD